MFVFAVVGFSKCKSLYLNERAKCYERQIYAFNPHKLVKKCVIHHVVISAICKYFAGNAFVTLMNSFQRWSCRMLWAVKVQNTFSVLWS